MKILVLLLFILATISSCNEPERNCADFKTGAFSFEYVVNEEKKIGKFTRDEQYSIEYYDNKIDSASVKWVNDCEFILQDLKTKSSVHMKILSTTADSYTFEYGIVGEAKKIQGTAIKTD